MDGEIWKDVVGYEGLYEVSSQGRVRRIRPYNNTWHGRILRHGEIGGARRYPYVALFSSGVQRKYSIHTLVARAFHGEKPTPTHEVNHKDFNKENNHATNVEWVTHADNIQHATSGGHWPDQVGSKNHSAKLTEAEVLAIRRAEKTVSQTTLAKTFGVTSSLISKIQHYKCWKHLK